MEYRTGREKTAFVLKGEVPTTTSRSIPVIPISASVSTDDNIVEIIFTVPLGEVKILVDGQVQEVCQVTVLDKQLLSL